MFTILSIWIVWGIFLVDYLIRFIKAEQKWRFIKVNPFLVIAIVPFDQFFQTLGVLLHGLALQWIFTKLDEMYTKFKNKENEKSI
ncbi:hypothetical protein ACNSTQ_13660 [Alkalihalobacterium sp. APHAB7]